MTQIAITVIFAFFPLDQHTKPALSGFRKAVTIVRPPPVPGCEVLRISRMVWDEVTPACIFLKLQIVKQAVQPPGSTLEKAID